MTFLQLGLYPLMGLQFCCCRSMMAYHEALCDCVLVLPHQTDSVSTFPPYPMTRNCWRQKRTLLSPHLTVQQHPHSSVAPSGGLYSLPLPSLNNSLNTWKIHQIKSLPPALSHGKSSTSSKQSGEGTGMKMRARDKRCLKLPRKMSFNTCCMSSKTYYL